MPVTQNLLASEEAAAGDADVRGQQGSAQLCPARLGHILQRLSPTPCWSRSLRYGRMWESNPLGSLQGTHSWQLVCEHIGTLGPACCS